MADRPALEAALQHLREHRSDHVQELLDLVRIPSISFPGFDPGPLRKCAEAVAALLRKSGLTDVRMVDAGAGPPAVFGQWTGAPGKPTLLMYSHYDVQPAGQTARWTTPPFEPAVRNGRAYGRGVSDDKGGIVMQAAAISSYLQGAGSLPMNVKLLIEGEEETGSPNLHSLLNRHRGLLSADAVLIADSENFASGTPSLTSSLRGIVTVGVEVRSLSSSVHSGTWGGSLPDPVLALAKMLSSLVDEDGRPAIPRLHDRVRAMTPQEQADLARLPFSEAGHRKQANLLDGVRITGGRGSVHEKMWYLPSLAVNAIEASSRKQAANIINDAAWARVGIRIVPDMDPAETLELLKAHLIANAPWGVKVSIEAETPSPWWRTETEGTLFQAALTALEQGYGKRPVLVGAGGSIPFVRTITEALGGVPAFLFGVGDPSAAAHSENENLLLEDWEAACSSVVHLLAELARTR